MPCYVTVRYRGATGTILCMDGTYAALGKLELPSMKNRLGERFRDPWSDLVVMGDNDNGTVYGLDVAVIEAA